MTTTDVATPTVQRLLSQADAHLKARRLGKAQKIYRTVQASVQPAGDGPAARVHALATLRIALILERRGRDAEALEEYARLTRPADGVSIPQEIRFAATSNAADLLRREGRLDEALEAFASALEVRRDPRVLLGYARALRKLARQEEAVAIAAEAVERDPAFFPARLFECVAQIRPVASGMEEIEADRAAYVARLEALAASVDAASEAERREAAAAVGLVQPFYLPYQARDERALQELYGGMVCRLMAARFPEHAQPRAPRRRTPGEPLRVGIVSRFLMTTHAVWRAPAGSWMRLIDRERFRLHAYVTADVAPAVPEDEALFHVVRRGSASVGDWAAAIARDGLDVIIYPEIGMDPKALPLAGLRLAPLQATSWGHPMTSGMPTIDAFLSSDLMEPEGAEAHYSEHLVRLPNLSFTPQRENAPFRRVSRETLGLSKDDVLYWCSQSLYKYNPAYDSVFPRIAREVPNARFVFSARYSGRLAEIFRSRIERVFAEHGLEASRHCIFRDGFPKDEYLGLCAEADVFLDSIGWSGCNTTFDVLAFDVPVVTLPTGPMRGRHTSAILTLAGLTEGIASDEEDYVARAVRLGRDREWRRHVSDRTGQLKQRLYTDETPVRALESVLVEAAAHQSFQQAASAPS